MSAALSAFSKSVPLRLSDPICTSNGAVRSLITLGSPYTLRQQSPAEVAIFGDEDPLVPPPDDPIPHAAFKKMLVLENTGHLGVLYHRETLRTIESELSSNSSI